MPQLVRDSRATRAMIATALLLLAIGAGFLWYAGPQLTAPFGESHDGLNGATWANGSRYLRDVGPIDSTIGGRRPDGTFYANHPPLIYPLTALAEIVGGERTVSTRAPAWIATLVSIPLLWLVLRRLRLGLLASAVGVACAATTPMLFVYGGMLDTPVLGFPVGVLVFLVWLRAWDDEELSPGLVGLLSLVAALIAWQAVFAVGLAAVSLGWRARRRRSSAAVPTALAIGGAAGVVLNAAWAAWVTGSSTGLIDQFRLRSGSEGGATWSGMLSHQSQWLTHLLGLAIVGLVACVVIAVRGEGLRRAASIASLAVVLGYAVLLHSGAFAHPYWNYWVILPVAIGTGIGADALADQIRSRGTSAQATTVVVVALALVVVGSSRLVTSSDRSMMDDGDVPARLLASTPLPASQSTMRYIGSIYEPEPWLTYLTRRPVSALADESELVAVAAREPDAVVLTVNSCVQGDTLCVAVAKLPSDLGLGTATDSSGTRYRVFTAEQLATGLGAG
ncbi:MAG: glycosyltransferase family 39 protein [Acidimicrobiales bacterium]